MRNKILVVDDETDIVIMLKVFFESKEWKILSRITKRLR